MPGTRAQRQATVSFKHPRGKTVAARGTKVCSRNDQESSQAASVILPQRTSPTFGSGRQQKSRTDKKTNCQSGRDQKDVYATMPIPESSGEKQSESPPQLAQL
jgi:hypothetical protein